MALAGEPEGWLVKAATADEASGTVPRAGRRISPLGAANRRVPDRWLKRKVDEYEHGMRGAGSYKGGKHGTTARRAAHNHAVQSSLVAMSYGAWTNDRKYFKTGVDQ